MQNSFFRKKAMDKISSPEQLTDYLKVTSPSIWLVLSVVVLIFVAFFAWASVGTLTTRVEASAVVTDDKADIVIIGNRDFPGEIRSGTVVEMAGESYVISTVDSDEYGRIVAHTKTQLPDGTYDAKIIVEQIHPIQFLIEGR